MDVKIGRKNFLLIFKKNMFSVEFQEEVCV